MLMKCVVSFRFDTVKRFNLFEVRLANSKLALRIFFALFYWDSLPVSLFARQIHSANIPENKCSQQKWTMLR